MLLNKSRLGKTCYVMIDIEPMTPKKTSNNISPSLLKIFLCLIDFFRELCGADVPVVPVHGEQQVGHVLLRVQHNEALRHRVHD